MSEIESDHHHHIEATPPPNQPQVQGPSEISISATVKVTNKKGEVLFSATITMIMAMSALNNYLRIISTSVLTKDLKLDQSYAAEISAIKLSTVKGDTAQKASISAHNQNKLIDQQVIQALLKAHQNQEQMDIQIATSTSTNSQQLASIISSVFQLISSVVQAIEGMNR